MEPTPLYEAQKGKGAVFCDVADWAVASSFGDSANERKLAQETVGIADRSHLGRIIARGSDTLDLLNRLTTNLVDPLPVGKGESTVITTGKGRILDWITMLHYNDDVLLITSPERREAVAEWIDGYTFEENTTLEDVTTSTAMVALLGPSAETLLETLLGTSTAQLCRLDCMLVQWHDHQVIVARTNPSGQPGFELVLPSEAADDLWAEALELGAAPIGQEALDALRIEAKLPKWGNELTAEHNPLEAGLEGEVSWTKGCYTGQEVVARLFNYQRVQRRLVAVEFSEANASQPGANLLINGETAGYITSVSTIPSNGTIIGLASLRTAYVELDCVLTIDNADGMNARVTWIPEYLNGGAAS